MSQSLFTDFIHAAKKGDVERLAHILSLDRNVLEMVDSVHDTALMHACSAQKDEAISFLLGKGANANHTNTYGYTPLMWCARLGNTVSLQRLLRYGALVDTQESNGFSALHFASKKNQTEVVRLLLDAHAKVDLRTRKGESALLLACAYDNLPVAETLILHGKADTNAQSFEEDVPLFYAVNQGNALMCKLLISHGADVNYQSRSHGTTALFVAVKVKKYFVLQKLIEYGGDYTIRSQERISLQDLDIPEVKHAIRAAREKLSSLAHLYQQQPQQSQQPQRAQHSQQLRPQETPPPQPLNSAAVIHSPSLFRDIGENEEKTSRIVKPQLQPSGFQHISNNLSVPPTSGPGDNEDILSFMRMEFDKIVGMEGVKSELYSFYKKVTLDRIREKHVASGLVAGASVVKKDTRLYHMLFTGPPGTGKTTMANLVSKVMLKMGLISSEKVVVVNNALDLIAGYVGQTPAKVDAKVKEAEGGVLFIDEAYSIVKSGDSSSKNTFGREAIDTLMKHMDPPSCVFILAGYEDKMSDFLQVNEGLGRRIPYRYNFSPYSTTQLTEILQTMVKYKDEDLEEGISRHIPILLEKFISPAQRASQNAGLIANWIAFAQMERDDRLDLSEARANPNLASLLCLVDFEKAIHDVKKMKLEGTNTK